jgi:hypothetical protein
MRRTLALRLRLTLTLMLLVASVAAAGAAEEDKDLELIPPAAQEAPSAAQPVPAAPGGNGAHRTYLEDAFTATPLRGHLAVPFPPPTPASWEDRLFLDSRDAWTLAPGLSLTYSGRLNLRAANDVPFPSHEGVRNDLREAFLSWQPDEATWLDLGRINLKSGVAVGYNPTDFFRTRAVVEPLTADPTVLREDRLGTLMLLGQRVWQGGSLTAAYAPKVTQPTALYGNLNLPTLDPMLDRTNAAHRLLLKGSVALAEGFSPEALVYHEGNRTQVGANLTTGLGHQTILYLEWAGGVRASLIDDALRYGRQTGSLPRNAPPVLPDPMGQRFSNDLSAGLSYVPSDTRLTLNLEYHFHQAGLSGRDWRRWFDAGGSGAPGAAATLWYIRAWAQDQQEPLSRHTLFVRADWVDAFVHDLEITALAIVNLQDGSALAQASADYYVSRAWTIGAQFSLTVGGRRSEFGSLPQAAGALLRFVRYL